MIKDRRGAGDGVVVVAYDLRGQQARVLAIVLQLSSVHLVMVVGRLGMSNIAMSPLHVVGVARGRCRVVGLCGGAALFPLPVDAFVVLDQRRNLAVLVRLHVMLMFHNRPEAQVTDLSRARELGREMAEKMHRQWEKGVGFERGATKI